MLPRFGATPNASPSAAAEPDAQRADDPEAVPERGSETLTALVADDRQPRVACSGGGERTGPRAVQVIGGGEEVVDADDRPPARQLCTGDDGAVPPVREELDPAGAHQLGSEEAERIVIQRALPLGQRRRVAHHLPP